MRAGHASRTAEYMALFRALESTKPPARRLFNDPEASRFLTRRLRAVVLASGVPLLGSLICAYIDRRWPGPRLSGIVRTRVIDDLVEESLEQGVSQLGLLGAGYDTRATRLAAATSARVFELDHPATQSRKCTLLGEVPERISYVPVDFERDSLSEVLEKTRLVREEPAFVLWEGVFSYLTPEAIDATLEAIGGACGPGSRLLLTYVDDRALAPDQTAGSAWQDAVSGAGEPFRTGLDPARAADFFSERGMLLLRDESTAEAARRLGVGAAEAIPGFYRLALLDPVAGRTVQAGSGLGRAEGDGAVP
jgi:methyltransferase (TIGR00027 family)